MGLWEALAVRCSIVVATLLLLACEGVCAYAWGARGRAARAATGQECATACVEACYPGRAQCGKARMATACLRGRAA